MAYVPGFQHDVFISYAHGDDRSWIDRVLDRLRPTLARNLPGADVWVDNDNLRRSRDFEKDIPANLEKSAVLVCLVSPIYIDRPYCVHHECRRFSQLVAARKQKGQRFGGNDFAADLFALRCPIVPLPDKSYWSLIPGSTDIAFCGEDDVEPFPIGSPKFEERFRILCREMIVLLRRMRNRSTPVLIYPRRPSSELKEAHAALTRELTDNTFLVLPDTELDPIGHVAKCELAVLLLGADYDPTMDSVAKKIRELDKPLLVWPSPSLEANGAVLQRGLFQDLLQFQSKRKSLLAANITADDLKREVLARLNPRDNLAGTADGKPRVYLVYDARQTSDKNNVGQIAYHYQSEFHFECSDNPRQDAARLTQSEGVLLVWGNSGEEWCAEEFDRLVRLAGQAKSRGICLFDPKDSKIALADQIRKQSRILVAEQFGSFDPARLEPFFNPIRKIQGART
jgi:hypothetical protein